MNFKDRFKKSFEPKKYIKSSSHDDRSIAWKIPLIFIPVFAMLLFPVNTTEVFSLILSVAGGIMVYISVIRIDQFKLSHRWKKIEGKLLHKKVVIDNPYAERDYVKSYFPYMKYSYSVEGRVYVSDKVANYRELRDFPEEIEEMMESLSIPDLIVYFNPKKPSESLLIPDLPVHRKIFWIFIFLLGLVLLTVGLLV